MGEIKEGEGKGREAALTEALLSAVSRYLDEGLEVEAVTCRYITEGLYRVSVFVRGDARPHVEFVAPARRGLAMGRSTPSGGSSGPSVGA